MKEENEERRTYLREIISNYTQSKRITTGSTIEEKERENNKAVNTNNLVKQIIKLAANFDTILQAFILSN